MVSGLVTSLKNARMCIPRRSSKYSKFFPSVIRNTAFILSVKFTDFASSSRPISYLCALISNLRNSTTNVGVSSCGIDRQRGVTGNAKVLGPGRCCRSRYRLLSSAEVFYAFAEMDSVHIVVLPLRPRTAQRTCRLHQEPPPMASISSLPLQPHPHFPHLLNSSPNRLQTLLSTAGLSSTPTRNA